MFYKSSDIALKDFYYDSGRNAVVSTKCPNEKDLIWRKIYGRTGWYVQMLDGRKVIKTVRKENIRGVFDVLMTAADRNAMPYKSSPVTHVYSASTQPEQCVTPIEEKKPSYTVCIVSPGGLALVAHYATLKDAQDAAEHRAKVQPGTKFAVIQILGTVVATGVTWE